jgi:hypothetical protein
MARRRALAERLRARLEELSAGIQEDLRLPSLQDNRLEGYAYLFRLILPLFNASGQRVFTDPLLDEVFLVLNDRFGGCMAASSSSAPPLWGRWHPTAVGQSEKDYLTMAEVLANPIEASNQFFAGLKAILKTPGTLTSRRF